MMKQNGTRTWELHKSELKLFRQHYYKTTYGSTTCMNPKEIEVTPRRDEVEVIIVPRMRNPVKIETKGVGREMRERFTSV